MTGRFSGKAVLVTGAGSGIGRVAAHLFARDGARVLATDVTDGAGETAAGHDAIAAMRCDAGSEDDVAHAVSEAVSRFGRLDIVFANAGTIGSFDGLFELDAAVWADVLRVNLIGPFLAIKYGARAMLDLEIAGSIVCTASVAGLRSGAGGSHYSASKAGVINLVQTSAQQLAGSGIRVNAVCPGLIETGMTRTIYESAREKGVADQIGRLNPMQRGGEPAEIASVVAFLASDAASYINGQAIAADGGLSSSLPVSRPPRLGRTAI
ncbi:SDR family NAD(P)-dependent oxidoreductase [Novosphingobium album (ex Hu et al. 2023)]|uniref:SDR family oxidoreductase n=1 Tax=Novosphingobium album (ex Hu et al. 2023) TaxID=2930093 RepID=A0ABT0B6R3_9SPHN|nr:SDR family NAD(P)-dependent oxidoreductase [Novosphingobium album (ex Hu et al. 2023)]MCJ2180755.1 SDR family oxidoreductase [Novosphingobium album (ex Hu et al. 2023)]